MRIRHLFGAVTAVASCLPAQTTVVVPSSLAKVEGNTLDQRPFGFDRVRFTQYIGLGLLKGVLSYGETITEIAYRRDGDAFPKATFKRLTSPIWTVRMGQFIPSTTRLRNQYLGPGGGYFNTLTTVLSGKRIAFPALGPVTTKPTPFTIRLPLDAPFLYSLLGGYFAIDHYSYELRNRVHYYYVDAQRSPVDYGRATAYGGPCPAGRNRAFAVAVNPGSNDPLELILFGAKAQTAAVVALGASNTSFGGLKLPYSLAPIGLQGCSLLASMENLIPVATNAIGSAEVAFKVPADPTLRGARFYSQWFAVDPAVNPTLPLVFSNGVSVTLGKSLGSAPGLDAFALYGVGLAANYKYGFLDEGVCLVTRFTKK